VGDEVAEEAAVLGAPPARGRKGERSPDEESGVMLNLIRKFVRDENGEDLIEYGLLAAFVAAVALVTIIADPLGIKGSLQAAFQRAKDALDQS
jgi:Flp pilus assembly pilin Flp